MRINIGESNIDIYVIAGQLLGNGWHWSLRTVFGDSLRQNRRSRCECVSEHGRPGLLGNLEQRLHSGVYVVIKSWSVDCEASFDWFVVLCVCSSTGNRTALWSLCRPSMWTQEWDLRGLPPPCKIKWATTTLMSSHRFSMQFRRYIAQIKRVYWEFDVNFSFLDLSFLWGPHSRTSVKEVSWIASFSNAPCSSLL